MHSRLVTHYVKCVQSFQSTVYPNANYGEVGKIYAVKLYTPSGDYYSLDGVGERFSDGGWEWVSAWRFESGWYGEKGLWISAGSGLRCTICHRPIPSSELRYYLKANRPKALGVYCDCLLGGTTKGVVECRYSPSEAPNSFKGRDGGFCC